MSEADTSGEGPALLEKGPQPRNDQREILALVTPLRRFVVSRTDNPHDADDVVQETLARVLAARGRLEDVTLTAYAFTVARNLIATSHREAEVHRRHAPRLLDLRQPADPEQVLLASEDRRALAAALDELPQPQRERLVEHVVHERPLGDLAGADGAGAAALTAQLGRARAKLRLDYLLALRNTALPTARCRPVLLAVSAGDQRRQVALRAGAHLLACGTCADLGEPLLQRQRALAGFVPWLPLGAWHGTAARWTRQHPAQAAMAAGSVVVAAVVVAALVVPDHRPAAGTPTPPVASGPPRTATGTPPDAALTGPRGPVLPVADDLALLVGQQVVARGVLVLTVPADEGFWVGDGPAARVWVQLPSSRESRATIRPGQRLSFVGTVVAHGDDYAAQVGVTRAEGADNLSRQGAHVVVGSGKVTVE